jgi:hypothetical protein
MQVAVFMERLLEINASTSPSDESESQPKSFGVVLLLNIRSGRLLAFGGFSFEPFRGVCGIIALVELEINRASLE